ncbi:MAG: hypothetical protein OXO50_05225, partial [Caldilineaceae bacterium]|nr:hypothetical protein [Caldilineaceae bacterium]
RWLSPRARHRTAPYHFGMGGLMALPKPNGALCAPLRLPIANNSQFGPVSGVIAEGHISPAQ